MSQFSSTIHHILIYCRDFRNKSPKRMEMAHQAILQVIHVLSEIHDAGGFINHFSSILEKLVKVTKFISKNELNHACDELLGLVQEIIEIEQDEFEKYYPKVKVLYEFLILNEKTPNLDDLQKMEINPDELSIISRLLRKIYHEGEPEFGSIENWEFENFVEIKMIRGKKIDDIAQEIRSKYVKRDKSDLEVIFFNDLIISAGLTFTEGRIIAKYLENRGIFVIRKFLQNMNIIQAMNALLTQESEKKIIFLDWDKFIPEKSKQHFKFCNHCGLPLKESYVIFEQGQMREGCDICQDFA